MKAERMLRRTGDRILSYSPLGKGSCGYREQAFKECNHDVGKCLEACREALLEA